LNKNITKIIASILFIYSISSAHFPETNMMQLEIESATKALNTQYSNLNNVSIYGDAFTNTYQTETNGYWQSTLGVDWNLGSKNTDYKLDVDVQKIKLQFMRNRLDSLLIYERVRKWQITRHLSRYETIQSLITKSDNRCNNDLMKNNQYRLVDMQLSCKQLWMIKNDVSINISVLSDSLSYLSDVKMIGNPMSDTLTYISETPVNSSDSLSKLISDGKKHIKSFEYDFGIRTGKYFGRENSMTEDYFVGIYFNIPIGVLFGESPRKVQQLAQLQFIEHKNSIDKMPMLKAKQLESILDSLKKQINQIDDNISRQLILINQIESRIKSGLEPEFEKTFKSYNTLVLMHMQMIRIIDIQTEIALKLLFLKRGKNEN
jgi:hypothetical protein